MAVGYLGAVPGIRVKFAVTFGRMHPRLWAEAAEAGDRLGFDSVWLPEHLVLPVAMAGSPYAGAEHPPVPPTTQLFDAALAALLRRGPHDLPPPRHLRLPPRSAPSLHHGSGLRHLGLGLGGPRRHRRGRRLAAHRVGSARHRPGHPGGRLDEAIGVCRRLWTEETITHDGPYFPFAEVAFEPKPVQQPIPILIGGESAFALRRAGRLGDGWIGMSHTPDTAAAAAAIIR